MTFIGSIDARLDLDPGRGQADTITRQNAAQNKSFTCMQFSPDSTLLLLGGDSNNFCLYSVADKMLVKKFTITENRSLDGVVLDVNRRNFTEFGNMALCDTSDSETEPDGKRAIRLPGSKHFDLGERRARPQVAVYALAFCPTGRRFAVCSTEGVGVYSLDTVGVFDPFQLDSQTTPEMIKNALSLGDYPTALMASLRLNDTPLIQQTMESTGLEQVALVVKALPVTYAEKLLKWIADGRVVANSTHVHFYMIWLRHILNEHGMRLKGRTDVAILTGIQQIVAHHSQLISKLTMPRVISVANGAKWKEGVVTGDFADAEFGFLGSFQELLPEDIGATVKAGKKKKTKDSNEQKLKKTVDGDIEVKDKKKKKRRKKKNKKDKVTDASEKVDDGSKNAGNVEKVKENGEEKSEKKKKKKRKGDKADSSTPAKKVKFAADVATAPLQNSSKKVENAAGASEKSEEIQRIVIDDEEDMEENDDTKVKSSWDELYLPEPIMEAIREMRFQNPTEIQRQVLPLAVRDRCDVLGAAETGSGKTLAYAIPMVARLLELPEEPHSSSTGPKALILAPTRELVVQVMKHVTALLKHTSFKAFPIVGGLAQVRQARILKEQKPEVIVATPGRLWAMMKEEEEGGGPACQYLSDWSGLLCLVVDETDRMVEKGHFEEMQDILQFVRKSAPEKLQTLVFSATLTYVHREQTRPGHANKKELTPQQKIKELIQLTGMRPHCKVVDITRAFGTAETLVETRINCSNLLEKDTTIVYLLERYKGRTLIFTNSVDASRRMYGILKLLKLQPLMIHAKMEQKVRLKNLEKFAADSRSVLLATDVAARGLDIQGIDNVIHYQVPKTAEIYIHRSGRTARASRKGLSVLIVDSKDAHLYRRLCKNLNREKDLPVFPIDCMELMRRLKKRVEIASALDTLAHRGKKIRLSENWFTKMIREADLEMDDMREHEQANANDEMNSIKAQEAELQAELRAELAEPLPSVDRLNIPKTRYINPDVVAQYTKITSTSTNTLDSLEEKLAEVEEKKKKARKLITTHQLKAKSFKRKKKF
ncbi:hypothetical protein Y032_0207g2018 [Ancylostoma ceylanicum]|nr:hypothetical protein Y032_0207g2018 [Ancylostoma ceylanicum]